MYSNLQRIRVNIPISFSFSTFAAADGYFAAKPASESNTVTNISFFPLPETDCNFSVDDCGFWGTIAAFRGTIAAFQQMIAAFQWTIAAFQGTI